MQTIEIFLISTWSATCKEIINCEKYLYKDMGQGIQERTK